MKFATSGAAALVALGLLAGWTIRREGTQESVRDAKVRAQTLARAVVQPALDDGALSGGAALARLDRLVRESVLGDTVVRVKLWTRDGVVVYSDETQLIGARYPLGEEERDTLRSGHVEAEASELGRRENRFERSYGRLLEVYLPLRAPDGTPVLFETYQRFSAISSESWRLWLAFAPAVLGGLILLWLIQIPLAASLARRMRHAHEAREAALRESVAASERERFAIAADLHDGVVQDLAGVSLTLAAATERLPTDAAAELRDELADAASTTRTAMRRLRSLIVEIYPSNLERVGLGPALGDLAAPLTRREIAVTLDVSEARYPPAVEGVVYRAAQEALRNVVAHARASEVVVRVRDDSGRVQLSVEDDGVGISAPELAARQREGHMGLRLLTDLVRGAGGALRILPRAGGGTCVELEVPLT
ncbi:MAG: histidine kinase [Gaiellales bacterium]